MGVNHVFGTYCDFGSGGVEAEVPLRLPWRNTFDGVMTSEPEGPPLLPTWRRPRGAPLAPPRRPRGRAAGGSASFAFFRTEKACPIAAAVAPRSPGGSGSTSAIAGAGAKRRRLSSAGPASTRRVRPERAAARSTAASRCAAARRHTPRGSLFPAVPRADLGRGTGFGGGVVGPPAASSRPWPGGRSCAGRRAEGKLLGRLKSVLTEIGRAPPDKMVPEGSRLWGSWPEGRFAGAWAQAALPRYGELFCWGSAGVSAARSVCELRFVRACFASSWSWRCRLHGVEVWCHPPSCLGAVAKARKQVLLPVFSADDQLELKP